MGNRLWIFGAVAAIIAIVVVGWLLGISPKLAEAALADSERATIETMNATQTAEIATLKEQKENFDELEAQLDKLGLSIPDGVLADDFVDSVSAVTGAAGVEIKKVTVGEGGSWGVTAGPAGAPAPTSGTDTDSPPIPTAPDGVYTVAVTIELRGEPAPVIAVLDQLQKAPRLFVVSDFTYDADADLKGVINGYLFVVRDPKAVPPAENIEPTAEPTPTPTDTPSPTPEPTETPSP